MKTPKPAASWLSVREAAVRLKRSYGQTMRLMEIGALQGRRTDSGSWQVSRESVDSLLRDIPALKTGRG